MGKIRNQGSASLEATLVMSVFLLAMVSLFWMAQSVLAEAQVYEAAAETAEYMAEIAYLGAADTAVAYLRFPKYADEKVEGMGFAIPISTAVPIINDIIKSEAVSEDEQGYLGIKGTDVSEEYAKYYYDYDNIVERMHYIINMDEGK